MINGCVQTASLLYVLTAVRSGVTKVSIKYPNITSSQTSRCSVLRVNPRLNLNASFCHWFFGWGCGITLYGRAFTIQRAFIFGVCISLIFLHTDFTCTFYNWTIHARFHHCLLYPDIIWKLYHWILHRYIRISTFWISISHKYTFALILHGRFYILNFVSHRYIIASSSYLGMDAFTFRTLFLPGFAFTLLLHGCVYFPTLRVLTMDFTLLYF